MDKLVVEAVTRESTQLTVTFTAILKESNAVNMPTSLKVTSGAAGIKTMPPFDWTKDKAIYQRWQLWSEKARHALDCMEGDSMKAKISYFYSGADPGGPRGLGPLTTKNGAPALKFYKIEAPEWQF